MCLETQVPNLHEKEAGICNVCVRDNSWTNLLLELQAEACDWLCSRVMRGAAVPSVTSNLFRVTLKARKVAGACVRRITVAQFV